MEEQINKAKEKGARVEVCSNTLRLGAVEKINTKIESHLDWGIRFLYISAKISRPTPPTIPKG